VFLILKQPAYPPRVMMQRAGYAEFRDPRTGEISYIRRLGTQFYPRFHVYFEEQANGLRVSLHLDQKKVSYEGVKKHNGEYNGPTVETEMERIAQSLTV
jgi:hypothetical protein